MTTEQQPAGYIFTFGVTHPLAGRYVAFTGSATETIRMIQRIFGGTWATQYDAPRGIDVVRRRNLTRLALGVQGEFDPVPLPPS